MKKARISTSKEFAEYCIIPYKIPKWKTDFINKTGKVLDVGCASGALSSFIGKDRYYGIDSNKNLVNYCKTLKLKAKLGRAQKISFKSNFFDCVFASHILEHLDASNQYKAFKEFYRVLKPGGKLILFSPTPFDIRFWDSPDHIRPLTHNSLKKFAENVGFEEIDTFYSKVRFLPKKMQFYLRSVPYFLTEVVLVCKK
jgi:ubiquinone/menaquinone biosynthesis C-methylase UbiE